MGTSRARLAIAAATLLLSTGGAAIKLSSLSIWQIASFRSAIAAAVMLAALPAARRSFGRGPWFVGAAQAACMLTFVAANKLTTAAATIYLQSTAPLYVLALGPVLLGERARRADFAYIAALAAGLGLLLLGRQQALLSAPDPGLGNALAALGGLSWALTVLGLRWLGRDGDAGAPQAAACAGNLLAFAACLPPALASGTALAGLAHPAEISLLLYLGVVQIALPYTLLTRGLRSLPALEASLLLLLEPVLNPLWAWLLQGEVPSPSTLAGGGLILVASAVRSSVRDV
jgi:drug/metabolite transporter, DME family